MRDKILVVGGGMMGCGISAVALAAGEDVCVYENNPNAAARVPERVAQSLKELVDNGLTDSLKYAEMDKHLTVFSSLEDACAEAILVIEAIIENVEAKQQVFSQLDTLLPDEVKIVSNTSGLRITDISATSVKRFRMATAHFWFPAHLVPLVEVVMSEDTTVETAEWVRDRLKTWGKAPVIVKKDLPGQLANRILQAVIREASNIVEMGLATPEDVDTAVKMGMGIRFPVWGPLEHVDGVGVDLCEHVQDTVLPGISDKHEANDLFRSYVKEGKLGYKSGEGFYDWSKKDMKKLEKLRNDFIIQSVKFIREREDD